jgi:hypothetical protein
MRPPLSDLEILAMPNMEIVVLYYSLAVVLNFDLQKPNDKVSRGLPYSYALNHDRAVQRRIYNLRPELHTVRDAAGQPFTVLANPADLTAPHIDENAVLIQALSVVLSIVTFGAAWWVTLIATIATTTASQVDQMQLQAKIGKASNLVKSIVAGIQTAKALLPDPQLSPQQLQLLALWRDAWNAYVQRLTAVSSNLLPRGADMPWPALLIAYFYQPNFDRRFGCSYYSSRPGLPPCGTVTRLQPKTGLPLGMVDVDYKQAIAAYARDWTPAPFFYSDTVRAQVDRATIGSLPIPSAQLIGSV